MSKSPRVRAVLRAAGIVVWMIGAAGVLFVFAAGLYTVERHLRLWVLIASFISLAVGVLLRVGVKACAGPQERPNPDRPGKSLES